MLKVVKCLDNSPKSYDGVYLTNSSNMVSSVFYEAILFDVIPLRNCVIHWLPSNCLSIATERCFSAVY